MDDLMAMEPDEAWALIEPWLSREQEKRRVEGIKRTRSHVWVLRPRVTAEDVASQREAGWPDWHPEDFCHRCGQQNMCWWVDGDEWNRAMEHAREWQWAGIVCPLCFAELWETATGDRIPWRLVPGETTRHASGDLWEPENKEDRG